MLFSLWIGNNDSGASLLNASHRRGTSNEDLTTAEEEEWRKYVDSDDAGIVVVSLMLLWRGPFHKLSLFLYAGSESSLLLIAQEKEALIREREMLLNTRIIEDNGGKDTLLFYVPRSSFITPSAIFL